MSVVVVMGALGLARFGYTLILPGMQEGLKLTNTQMGALATGNFIGYLTLSVAGGFLAARYGPRLLITVSMLLVGVTMLLTGLAPGFEWALVWRTLTGIGSGGCNVPVMALLPAWFAPRRRGLATGIAVGGSSVGLVIAGPLVPRIFAAYGDSGWRYSWYYLAGLVLLIAVLSFLLLRNRPGEKGLSPVGAEGENTSPAGSRASSLDWGLVYKSRTVWHLAFVYTMFGFSYIIYMTFFAKYLIAEGGYTKAQAGNLFMVVGWVSIVCGLIWGTVSDWVGRKYGLAMVYAVQAMAYLIFALWPSPTGFTLSAVLFGLTAWSIPGIMAATCGDHVGSRLAPAALGFVTLFFGIGQAAGPYVAGRIADATASFSGAFVLAAVAALVGVGSALLLRPPGAAE